MNTILKLSFILGLLVLGLVACKKEPIPTEPTTTKVIPLDVNTKGLDFLDKMQGHWVGANRVITTDYDWFTFDYRAISPSHIHGIHEAGSAGNLLTSFFVTNYKNTRTIMARNGGLLNGIYRSSYFVMDSTRVDPDSSSYYRLVDAKGGTGVMYMELRFVSDSLYFNVYTGRLGLMLPTRHMTFRAKKKNLDLAQTAAAAVNFPQNIVEQDFSNGFVENYLYVNLGESEAKSATFLNNGNNDLITLANGSGDPFIISDYPYISSLEVNMTRNSSIDSVPLLLYLSKGTLTDASGYMLTNAFDDVLQFPEISAIESQFKFTYLHPGTYYVTVVADKNGNGFPDTGDITHVSQSVVVTPNSNQQQTINNINIQN